MQELNYKELKRVSVEHHEIISRMQEVLCQFSIECMDAVNGAFSYGESDEIQATIQGELDKCESNLYYDQLLRLLSSLYKIKYHEPIVDTLNQVNNTTVPIIQNCMSDIKRVNNGIKSLFASSAKKNKANEAFMYLNNLLEGTYKEECQKLEHYYYSINNNSVQNIITDFKDNKKSYSGVLDKYSEIKHNKKIKVINDILKEYKKYEKDSIIDEELIKEVKATIIKTISDIINREAAAKLDSIPIQSICGDIKPTPFLRAGYRTVGSIDLFSASIISDRPSINWSDAHVLKKRASELKRDIISNTKLKMSLDNLSYEKDKLIELVYYYKTLAKERENFSRNKKEREEELSACVQTLKKVPDTIGWFFMSDEQKQKIFPAYKVLKTLLYSEYPNMKDKATKLHNRKKNISFADAYIDFQNDSVSFFNAIESIYPGALGNNDKTYGLGARLASIINSISINLDGLKCTLRSYQEMGVRYILYQSNVLLGDEMGLGKTIQAIATMVSLRNNGATHFIVVCPACVLINWEREVIKHSNLESIIVHGNYKRTQLKTWKAKGGVCITTYETTNLFDSECRSDMLVVDEAHYIKNPNAARTKNTIKLCELSNKALFMTGTPLENRVDEMISLIRVLRPDIALKLQNSVLSMYSEGFKKTIIPVYYRRKRDDVLTELPDKIEAEEWLTPSSADLDAYKEALGGGVHNVHDIRRVSWNSKDISKSCKALRLMELVEEAFEDGRKIIVYSFYLDVVSRVSTMLGDKCKGVITGSVNSKERQRIIDDFDKAGSGAVLVAQIQSGGVGLNIQSASVVIICEPQVKPSIENQAISRAYRMGQTRNVLVYRLLCKNTIDERMMQILSVKQSEFDMYADESLAAKQASIDEKSMVRMIEDEIREKIG